MISVPQPSNLNAGEVHVWWLPLGNPNRTSLLEACLSGEERKRAGSFIQPDAARRFVVCHGLVRHILSQYLAKTPGEIVVRARADGKPYLNHRAGEPPLHFNLSHSADLAVLAVTKQTEVGVDIEHIRPLHNLPRMVERCLAARERAVWSATPAAEQLKSFFQFWTYKEAYLKSSGLGIRVPLDRIEIECDDRSNNEDRSPRIGVRHHDHLAANADAVQLLQLTPPEDWVGALAITTDQPLTTLTFQIPA